VRTERTLAVTSLPARFGKSTQVLDLAHAVGARERRQARRDERQVERDGARDFRSPLDHTRIPREPATLLGTAAQARAGGRRQARVEFVEAASVAHRGECAGEHVVAGRRIRHVVGGDGLHVALRRDTNERVVAPHIERVAVVPHFDEHAVAAECLDEQLERSSCGVRAVGVQRSRERALGSTGEHEALAAHALRERLDIKDGVRLCSAKLAVGERLRQRAVAGGAVGDDDEIAERVLERFAA